MPENNSNTHNHIRTMIETPDMAIKTYKIIFVVFLIALVISTVVSTVLLTLHIGSILAWIISFLSTIFLFKGVLSEKRFYENRVDLYNFLFYFVMSIKDRDDVREELLSQFPDYYRNVCYDILKNIKQGNLEIGAIEK